MVNINSNNDFFQPVVSYTFQSYNQKRVFTNENLLHLKYFNPSYTDYTCSLYGLSPVQVAHQVIQTGNDRWDASMNMFQNRGAFGLITDKSNRPMNQDQAKKVQESFDYENTGSHNYGKIKVTNKDLSYISMAMSPQDLQLLESGVITLRALCNVYNVDSSMFNDPANKTYNNQLEAQKAFYNNCIIPLSNKLSEQLTRFIALNHYPDGSYRMVQDFDDIEALQTDKKAEAERDKIVIDGINVILNMPISAETKAIMIKENYDVSDELINSYIVTSQTGNKQLNILSKVSPLLANKFIEFFNDSEIRKILELQGEKITPQQTNQNNN
jgi:HK97 family phage portal protein